MAERRRPNARQRRQRQRQSYQPAFTPDQEPPQGETPEEPTTRFGSGPPPGDPGSASGAGPESRMLEPTTRGAGYDSGRSEREDLAYWKRCVARARRVRGEWERRYQVERLERFFLGQHTDLGDIGNETLEVYLNHFFATVQAQRPAVLPTALTFLVQQKPGKAVGNAPASALQAKIMSGVLDAIAQQDNHLMKSLRLAATQAFFRVGVLKACYDPQMRPNPRAGQPLLNAEDQALIGLQGESLVEPAEIPDDEVYRWAWVNAQNMLFPDQGPDTTRWTWLGEDIDVTLEEAQDDTSFPSGRRAQLRANGRRVDGDRVELGPPEDPASDAEEAIFRYTEVWDIRHHQRYVWAEGQTFDGFLVSGPVPDGVEDHPYSLLLPVPIIAPRPLPWPKPLCHDWLPIQQQYNIVRNQQLNAGKRAARKIIYTKDTFPDSDEATKFLQSSQDLEGVEVNDLAHPPIVIGDGAQSPDVAKGIPYLLADWQRVTGATGTRLGDPQADTATEAVLTEQSAAVRDSELRTLVTEWLAESGRKMLQLVKQTLTLDMWVNLRDMDDNVLQEFLQSPAFAAYATLRMGPQMGPMFVNMIQQMPQMWDFIKQRFGSLKPLQVSRADLQWEADVQVQPSTIRPLYRAQLLQLTSLLGPVALMSPTLVQEVLHSFEIPQADQIVDELTAAIHSQGGMAALMGKGGAPGGAPAPGTPNPQSAGLPMGTQNMLGSVTGTNPLGMAGAMPAM